MPSRLRVAELYPIRGRLRRRSLRRGHWLLRSAMRGTGRGGVARM